MLRFATFAVWQAGVMVVLLEYGPHECQVRIVGRDAVETVLTRELTAI